MQYVAFHAVLTKGQGVKGPEACQMKPISSVESLHDMEMWQTACHFETFVDLLKLSH